MKDVLITVVIPLYNQSVFILDAVNSVLASTYNNIEIIVVNDGSTDITESQLYTILPNNVRIISQNNQGVSAARNKGISEARGEYIFTLDADDKVHPKFIEKAVNVLVNNQNICIVYAKAEYFGNKTGEWFFPTYDKNNMLIDNLIPSFAMFRKTDWKLAGGYNLNMEIGGEDWEFWISLIEKGGVPYRIDETLLYYRIHNMSKTAHNYNKLHWKIFKRILSLHPNLYLDNIFDLAFPLFFRVFKELKPKEQLNIIRKLFVRAFFHPITRYINRKNLKNINQVIKNFKININNLIIKNNYKKVLKKIKRKRKIKVVFMCSESSKWNYKFLYNKMAKNDLFYPEVILYPQLDILINKDTQAINIELESEYKFFQEQGLNVKYGYIDNKYIPVNKIKPDIVFYEQPHYIPEEYSIKNISRRALCMYTPYGYENLDLRDNYTNYFHKRLYTYFVENDYQVERYEMYSENNKKNCFVSGCLKMEAFNDFNKTEGVKNNKLQIIYAPHHSIEQNGLRFSTFLETGQYILSMAKKYQYKIDWIFKPHPRLRYALVKNNFMTENEVDEYYKEWQEIGILYDTGNYIDLFKKSDALITDSISFLAEYLPVNKPIIQLVNPQHFPYNAIGYMIDKCLYKVFRREDFKNIFHDIILNGNDYLKENREKVIPQIYDITNSPSEKIIKYIENILED